MRFGSAVIVELYAVWIAALLGASAEGDRLSVDLNTNAWNLSAVPAGGTIDTWYDSPGYFAVSNSGTVAARVYLSVTNSSPSGWKPGSTPGIEQFALLYAREVGRPLPHYRPLHTETVALHERLAPGEVGRFDLRFEAPLRAGGGIEETMTVNVMSIESE